MQRNLTVDSRGTNANGKVWLRVHTTPTHDEILAAVRKGCELGERLYGFAHNIPAAAKLKLNARDTLECEECDARIEYAMYSSNGVDILGAKAAFFVHGSIKRTEAPEGVGVTCDW